MNVGHESGRMEILANRGIGRRRESSVTDPTASFAGQRAEWLPTVVTRLRTLAQLEEGWDGRNARRISPANLDIAMRLLRAVMRTDTPIPELVPTVRGGLQIEWHVQDVDVELEILSAARYVLSLEDRANDNEFDLELTADLSPLVAAIKRISPSR